MKPDKEDIRHCFLFSPNEKCWCI